ncbi:excisionase [Kosakonia sp. S42]|uniref:excisionase n=1 Tax=Kosakonia sp. S42 TaxID=2767458 RepID=UPI0028153456|nr:excisionase [Kosakonia sp. S42]
MTSYCNSVDETLDAVNKQLQRGVWQEGVHVLKVDGSKERWIDLAEIARWTQKNKDPHLSQGE